MVFVIENSGHVSGICRVVKRQATELGRKPLRRKEPQSCDGRVLSLLRNDAVKFRLEENCKTPFIVGC